MLFTGLKYIYKISGYWHLNAIVFAVVVACSFTGIISFDLVALSGAHFNKQ